MTTQTTIKPELNQIIVGDALEYLQALPAGGMPLFLFSPPYNLGSAPWEHLGNWKPGDSAGGRSKWQNGSDAANGIQYSEHKDTMPHTEYVAWQHAILRECWRCLPDHGAIFYNHKPRVIGARLWTPLELIPNDLITRQIIIWARAGGLNFNPTAYVPTHEWIIVLAKPGFRLKSKGASGVGDVWSVPQVSNTWHPAPFPLVLAERVMETVRPALVCDPFMGSGTTAKAAKRYGVDWMGCDKSAKYAARARLEIDAIQVREVAMMADQELMFDEDRQR